MSKILSAVLLAFVLVICSFTFLPRTSANPLPVDLDWRGMGGGAPVPTNSSFPVFLSQEVVKAVIDGKQAHMTCTYTFLNELNEPVQMNIELPFIREPEGLVLYLDGEELQFLDRTYDYDPIEGINHDYLGFIVDKLYSVIFHVQIEAQDDVEVRAEYDTEINTYWGMQGPLSYYYSYLVGTGRYWNHPIESARFEVRVPAEMFSKYDHSDDWEMKRTSKEMVFEKEYTNWVPDQDLILLTWKETSRTPVETTIFVILGMGLGLLVLAVVSSVIYVIWRRARADRLSEE